MNKSFSKLLVLTTTFFLTACGGKNNNSVDETSKEQETSESSNTSKPSSNSESISEIEGHSHTWDNNWSSDANNHWHKCTGTISGGNTGWGGGWGGTPCTATKDQAPHTFDQGSITTPASAYSDGVKTYTCTVCNYKKTESIPATGPTDEKKGNFSFNDTELNTVQEIHTENHKKMIEWGKTHQFYTELNSSVLTSLNASGRDERSHPNQVTVKWNYTVPSGKTVKNYSLVISPNSDLSNNIMLNGTTTNSLTFYNAFIGNNYFKVIANLSDNTTEVSDVKIFKVNETAPRIMKMGSMSNCRDMGGRTTVSGGKIKQGLIYRTADPEGKVDNTLKDVMLNQLKVKTEIYVKDGKTTTSPLGSSVKYYNCSMDYGTGAYSNLSRNAERIRKVFDILADENSYPTFYHCRIGTDRTGIVAILLNGLLGVDFNETIGDHAFSNYAPIDGQRYANSTKVTGQDPNGDDIAKYVDEILAMPGKNFQEQVYYSLLSIGISSAKLNKIIDFLTEGPKATLPTNFSIGSGDKLTASGATKKTASDYTHPETYYEVSNGKSVSYKVNVSKAGKSKVVVYMGNKTKSSTLKIATGISLKIDNEEKTIVDKNHEKAGFGITGQNNRTGYMFNQFGEYDFTAGEHTITISGKSSEVFNVALINVIGGETSQSGNPDSGNTGGSNSSSSNGNQSETGVLNTWNFGEISANPSSIPVLTGKVNSTDTNNTSLYKLGENHSLSVTYNSSKNQKVILRTLISTKYTNRSSTQLYVQDSQQKYQVSVNDNNVTMPTLTKTFNDIGNITECGILDGSNKMATPVWFDYVEINLVAGSNVIKLSKPNSAGYSLSFGGFEIVAA